MIFRFYAALWIVASATVLYGVGHHQGWTSRDAEMQIAITKKDAQARQAEHVINQQLAVNQVKLQKAKNVITEKQTALDTAIRTGRVHFPTCGVQPAASSSTPVGSGNETSSESDRQTLSDIAAIVADGDRNTAQLNACIDAYNTTREQINGIR
jgi:hypothetical protein